LLIVIVIIGILISIALPNFQAAQNRAKNASLESNMRTLSVIAQTYSVDWGGNVAEDVNVLHNEAVSKNYWKDLKNPFTGQSGLGFAISNYSQAVSLISLLHGVKLAMAIEPAEYMKKQSFDLEVSQIAQPVSEGMYYKAQPAIADYAAKEAITEETLPTADQIFSSEGQIAYFPDISGTNYAVMASGKDVGSGNVKERTFLSKKGVPFVLSPKGADKLASALKEATINKKKKALDDGEGLNPAHKNQDLYNNIYEKVKSGYSDSLESIAQKKKELAEKKAYYEKQVSNSVDPELADRQKSLSKDIEALKDYRAQSEQKN